MKSNDELICEHAAKALELTNDWILEQFANLMALFDARSGALGSQRLAAQADQVRTLASWLNGAMLDGPILTLLKAAFGAYGAAAA